MISNSYSRGELYFYEFADDAWSLKEHVLAGDDESFHEGPVELRDGYAVVKSYQGNGAQVFQNMGDNWVKRGTISFHSQAFYNYVTFADGGTLLSM